MVRAFFDRYGVLGSIRLFVDKMTSGILFPNARIVRRPFYIRGKRHIRFGKGFTSGFALRLDAFPLENKTCIEFGENVQVNDYVHICGIDSVRIGNNVLIASKVFITDHNHGSYGQNGRHDSPLIPPAQRPLSSAKVEIEDNVWLGEFVVILPGVKIGKGSIIGSMSVVTKNIPPYSIAVGSPAKIVKTFDFTVNQWIKT